MRENLDARVEILGLDIATVLLKPDSKEPCMIGYQRRGRTLAQVYEESSYCLDGNVGIITGQSISGVPFGVIDFDDKEEGWNFVRQHRIDTSISETRRGVHLYVSTVAGGFPNRIHPGGRPVDLIGASKYVVAPHSKVRDWVYRWITPLRKPRDLQPFEPKWFDFLEPAHRDPGRKPAPERAPDHRSDRQLEWARGILFSEYFSVEGANGDHNLFRAACFLLQRACLGWDDAYRILADWNTTNAVPPWPDQRLRYKLDEARRLMK